MVGFILELVKVRDEDLLVRILTQDSIMTLYRFYGARHSSIAIGYKIDFIIEQNLRIPKLREPLHLAQKWEKEPSVRYFWQSYLSLLGKHLRDISELDSFYFKHLENGAKRIQFENPKRCILNLYSQLLNFEGRANPLKKCLICEQDLSKEEEIVLLRGAIGAHINCIDGYKFRHQNILAWLNNEGEMLEENEVEALYKILETGL